MQEQPTEKLPGSIYKPTPTKYISQRGSRFRVRWSEHGVRCKRIFGSYEAACGFVRDYVRPFKENQSALPPSTIAPGKGTGWVYVFRSAGYGEPVKVGWSTDPARRLRDLATGHPHRIDLVALLPAARNVERALHERLSEYRLEGEWFSREAEAVIRRAVAFAISSEIPGTSPWHATSKKSGFAGVSQ